MAALSPITVARFWSKVSVLKSEDECWHWKGARNGSGYGSFRVPEIGRVTVSAHRVAYFLYKEEWPDDELLVRHKCDNPICVNPHHLELGTHVDNGRDMVERGRGRNGQLAGEENGNAKLTAVDVAVIRVLIAKGAANTDIAETYGVHHATISAIRRGKSWAA